MERLEAALEKAREKRRANPAIKDSEKTPIVLSDPDFNSWQALQELKISSRVARNGRITTLSNNAKSGPYDMLRSRAMRIMGDNNWKRLAVTSPNMACGKTTVATNLAFSLARQSDIRVGLLDMDLRRPSMHKVLGHRDRLSLHEMLDGQVSPKDQLLKASDNLLVGLNYKPARNPAELLQSSRTKQVLEEIERTYQLDFMIFDMPPMLVSDDNVGFMQNVDCALLVGAAEETTIQQLDNCEKELAELTNVLGLVLNKVRYQESGSGYEYDYY